MFFFFFFNKDPQLIRETFVTEAIWMFLLYCLPEQVRVLTADSLRGLFGGSARMEWLSHLTGHQDAGSVFT